MAINYKDTAFKHPFCMTIAGSSQSGKTYFVPNILININFFVNPLPKSIIYCYSEYQKLFETLSQKIQNIKYRLK